VTKVEDLKESVLRKLSKMYKITIVKKAQDDLAWFRRNDKSSYLKCFDLVRDIMQIAPRISVDAEKISDPELGSFRFRIGDYRVVANISFPE